MKRIYSSIDIGTDTIKLVVCELYNNRLNLLAASSVKSKGIKKGLIVDPNEATISIKQAFDEVESMLGIKIKQVIANIPAYFAEYNIVKSIVDVDSEDQVITGEDIVKVLDESMDSNTEVNREMVNLLPIDFTLDNGERVKDPKGMISKTLQSRAIIATAPKKSVYSVVGILNNMGIDIADISFGSVGDIYTFNNSSLDSKIGCILNIGHETTTISLYNKGVAVKSSVICMGSKNITNDLAYMYKISIEDANMIKEKFAFAHKKYASSNEFYELLDENNNIVRINQLEASEIVMARINEILDLADKEINSLTSHKIEYIIVTGGTSNMQHFEYCLGEHFKEIAYVGNITIMGIRNNKYSVALGNIICFVSKLKLKGVKATMVEKQSGEEIGIPSKNSINISSESMISKVFGYFFGQ